MKSLDELGYTLQNSGDYKGQCPFRERHNYVGSESFFLSPKLNRYHCFSCGSKGFLSHLLRDKYQYATSDIMDLCSIFNSDKKEKVDTCDLLVNWSVQPEAFIARGISAETLKKFRVGMYGTTITLPQYNIEKKLKGVVYRFADSVNSAGTRLKTISCSKGFDKNEILYGENLIVNYESITLVEGNTDVFRLYDWGIQCLGTQGSSISETQLNTLRKFEQVIIASDNDKAGNALAHKVYEGVKKFCNVKLLDYSKVTFSKVNGKDPDEAIKDTFLAAHDRPINFLQFKLNKFAYTL